LRCRKLFLAWIENVFWLREVGLAEKIFSPPEFANIARDTVIIGDFCDLFCGAPCVKALR